ncbi:hypothetical protein DUI87_01498 [Hirundo rustica rustica]|uniref:ribonuclease H n=1 Tax=Hirundo rustica rustica TaxID=333673 RepID=A0A3M0L6P9_HIRRU|nr:hypothetical protein DUI87_01498 [Hirundo rustica rustica]
MEIFTSGMRNSPVLCQWYVARALSGVRKQFPDAHVYHYMDDILVAAPTQDELLRLQPQLLDALHSHGLQVAPEKVQQQPPWKYLGVKILERTIRHQAVQFVQSVKTLNDAQKLVGIITRLCPYLGLTIAQLSPLFELLKGDTDLKSPRELTPEARKVLEEVQQAVSACQVYRIEPSIDVTVFITTPDLHPAGIIGQWNDDWTDPLHVLEWVFLSHQPHKTATALFELIAHLIIKCQQCCLQLMGADPSKIILPVQREEFDLSCANNVLLQSALEGFSGQITYHLPSHKLLQVAKNTQFSLWPKSSQEPVQGPTVFTDGSGKTGKAIVTWQDGSEWQVLESHEDGSAQLVELKAAVMAFETFSQEPFNLITDSAYVADIAQRLSCSVLKEVSNPALFHLLKALWCAIQARVHPYYVLHVRSHTNLPGFVAEGNARADKLANPAWVAPQPDVLTQAKVSHGFFHQNAHTLQKQFQLMATEAREIVESCDDCHALGAPLPAGVNPRGLKALELWQTDVTRVAEFGWLKYVHVTVDMFSSAMWVSAHTGEKACDVIAHWRQAFERQSCSWGCFCSGTWLHMKKKSKSKSVCIVTDEDVAGPLHPAEETEPEIITRSLSLGELCDLQREFTHQTNESILTWLLRIWDAAANDTILDGSEARQMGSLSRDVVINQGIGRTQQTLSLWRRLLTSVRDRYLCKEDLQVHQGKWSTMEQGIRCLRELAVLEIIFSEDERFPKSPDDVRCTSQMWLRFAQLGPEMYSRYLAMLQWREGEDRVSVLVNKLRIYEDTVTAPFRTHVSSVETRLAEQVWSLIEEGHQKLKKELKEEIYHISPEPTRVSAIRSRYPPARERGYTPRSNLWSFLREHGEDMRKWDGKPTSSLAAQVRELKRETPTTKSSSRANAAPVSQAQNSRQYRKDDMSDLLEGTSGTYLQEESNVYHDQE